MMKIIVITDQYPPIEYGGMAQHAFHISKYLSVRHDIMVILPIKYKNKIHDIDCNYKAVLTMKYLKYDEYQILKIANQFNADVIHICTAGMAYTKVSKKYPVVLRVVGNDFMRPWRGRTIIMGSILFRIPNKKLYNYLIRKQLVIRKKDVIKQMMECSRIVANSDWTRERLLENNIEKKSIELIVGGYNSDIFVPPEDRLNIRRKVGIEKNNCIVVTAANLVRKKGIDTVIKAISELVCVYNIEYYVLGDGEELNYLKDLTTKLKIENIVHFMGRKTQIELSQYYQAADIYVQVSRDQRLDNGGVDVETMGRTYFEAGACGIPVIASRTGGIPSVIEHENNGLLINDSESVKELVETIKTILNDNEKRKRISLNAVRKSKEEFSWEKVVCRFENIFNDVCTKN